tara:strand:- start:248 stop:1594 length:1347 start_codon:yes stop_codon:yes gene_type:complete
LGKLHYSYTDLLLVPLFVLFIFLIAKRIKKKHIKKNPEYKYLIRGVFAKLTGVSLFLMFYTVYYDTGDTISYFEGAKAICKLLFSDFEKGYNILFNMDSNYNSISSFNYESGRPPSYIFRDTKTFNVSRFSVGFYFFGAGSLIISNYLCALFSFIGIWKLYRVINTIYGGYTKELAYIILFMPSLIFWGSGIMKDSFVLGALCWLTSNFYNGIINRKNIFSNVTFLILNFLIIINIKPYVALGVIPGMLLWINANFINSFSSPFIRFVVRPFILIIIIILGNFIFDNLEILGLQEYSNVDQTIEQAQVIQQDLLREEQYGSNSYNIGTLDGTLTGMLKLAPKAIFTSIYRPLFFEIGSPAMAIAAIENFILLIFTLLAIIKTNPFRLYKKIASQPFLLYCLIFTLVFGFGVGIASTNFGALVRYRIPLIPFYFTIILILFKKRALNKF